MTFPPGITFYAAASAIRVEFGEFVLRESPADSLDVGIELLRERRARDDARHGRARCEPAECEFQQSATPLDAKRVELLDLGPVALSQKAIGRRLRVSQPRFLRQRLAAPVLAGQQSAGEREERQQAESVRVQRRQQLAVGVARKQTVLILRRDERVEIVQTRSPHRFGHLPRGHVRTPDIANLALARKIVQSAQRLLDRRQRIGQVLLVQVDPVRFQPSQTGLDRGHDVTT